MPEATAHSSSNLANPDYAGLVAFLVKPFLEVPESLKVDCEVSQSKAKVWVRLAFEGSDKGRVFGRGGRNIQAIRTVLEGLAKAAGYTAHLDIYGGFPHSRDGESEGENGSDRPPPRRGPRGSSKPRSRH
jgi:predicted RNA-binding protein YlqC (UPF0109 family)